MSAGKTNLEREKIFERYKKNYIRVYSIDSITKYINFCNIIKKRNGKYPFDIFNTDKHSKPGMHWWRILDIYPPPKIIFI